MLFSFFGSGKIGRGGGGTRGGVRDEERMWGGREMEDVAGREMVRWEMWQGEGCGREMVRWEVWNGRW